MIIEEQIIITSNSKILIDSLSRWNLIIVQAALIQYSIRFPLPSNSNIDKIITMDINNNNNLRTINKDNTINRKRVVYQPTWDKSKEPQIMKKGRANMNEWVSI